MQRDLGKRSDKGRGTHNKKKLDAHLTTDRTALPAGERKDFDVVLYAESWSSILTVLSRSSDAAM